MASCAASVNNATSGIRAEYQFDDLDRLTNIVWRNAASGVLRSFAYGYNSAGMITNVTRETASENVAYGYDSLDRLTSATAPYLTASYGWDLAGNPSSRTENGTNTSYTLGTGNKLVSMDFSGDGCRLAAGTYTGKLYYFDTCTEYQPNS